MRKHTTSTSASVVSAREFARSPSSVRGLCTPGVSRNTICVSSVVRTPRTCVRVVCGLSETIDTFCPRIWLRSVDLPTFGRPTIATNPDRNGVSLIAGGSPRFFGDDLGRSEQAHGHRHDAPAVDALGAELEVVD